MTTSGTSALHRQPPCPPWKCRRRIRRQFIAPQHLAGAEADDASGLPRRRRVVRACTASIRRRRPDRPRAGLAVEPDAGRDAVLRAASNEAHAVISFSRLEPRCARGRDGGGRNYCGGYPSSSRWGLWPRSGVRATGSELHHTRAVRLGHATQAPPRSAHGRRGTSQRSPMPWTQLAVTLRTLRQRSPSTTGTRTACCA